MELLKETRNDFIKESEMALSRKWKDTYVKGIKKNGKKPV